jgi:hypothetical protein
LPAEVNRLAFVPAQINFQRLARRPTLRIKGRLPMLVLKIGFRHLHHHPSFSVSMGGVVSFQPPDECAAGHFDDEIFSGMAIHALAHAVSRRPPQ